MACCRRSAMVFLCSGDSSRFCRKGFTPMRNGQLGQLTAVHLRTSLATPQQQSRRRARRAFRGFFVPCGSGRELPEALPEGSSSAPQALPALLQPINLGGLAIDEKDLVISMRYVTLATVKIAAAPQN